MRRLAFVLIVCAACSDDAQSPTADAPPAMTNCGAGDLTCNAATEICVVQTPVGPSEQFACMPLPAGCANDRTCGCAGDTLCVGSFNTCSERAVPNTIACECLQCQ